MILAHVATCTYPHMWFPMIHTVGSHYNIRIWKNILIEYILLSTEVY